MPRSPYRDRLRHASPDDLLDPLTGFMRARVEGFWMTPFDHAEVNSHYTEANAWQYSSVPHDVAGLARLLGGFDILEAKLDALFSASSKTTGREQADITGLIGQYAPWQRAKPPHRVPVCMAGRPVENPRDGATDHGRDVWDWS